jgi:pimeloyl-ACP methyl ester carboxylesterase
MPRLTLVSILLGSILLVTACGPSTQHGTVNGIAYDVAGAGPIVVLVADSAGRAVWAKQFAALAKSFEVVQYDPADGLAAVLDHLHIAKTTLIALGAGAGPAIDVTLAHPDRIEGLVLVSPHLAATHGALGDLKTPMLLIVGTHGDSAAGLGVDSLRAHVGGVATITMPGAGHQVNVDKAPSFNRVVAEFLFKLHPEAAPHRS